jgi:uncharacterized membrane protein YidH (DUF202 family)
MDNPKIFWSFKCFGGKIFKLDFNIHEMKSSDIGSVERTFLSKERSAMAEERTVLAYINTELTFLGVVAVILKLYFEKAAWTIYVTAALFVFVGAIVLLEVQRIKKLRKERKGIEREEKSLG